jgi:hypothetical protein
VDSSLTEGKDAVTQEDPGVLDRWAIFAYTYRLVLTHDRFGKEFIRKMIGDCTFSKGNTKRGIVLILFANR